MEQMRALSQKEGFKLAFVMDGVREAVYSGKPVETYEVHKLNIITRDLTAELELPFLDLQETFAADYARSHKRFEFGFDWHWNAMANRLAGEAIVRFLRQDRSLLGDQPTGSSAAPMGAAKG
jgi:hypothetical protein